MAAKGAKKSILFLCTGNYYRSRFAEILFNAVAGRMGLPWQATSRGLALERGIYNIGPISMETVAFLDKLGIQSPESFKRMPASVTLAELEQADHVIALKQAEHEPLFVERFPGWETRVTYWHVDDAPGALEFTEKEVMALVARLFGGGGPGPDLEAEAEQAAAEVARQQQLEKDAARKSSVVRVSRETKGRRGKGVTIVSGLPLTEDEISDLAGKLKQSCGTGGTVKEGCIEIQGDQRERVQAELERLGFRVKRSGG